MYIKNLLKSGTYFIPVPVGIPITLQYSVAGRLQRVFIGHDLESAEDCSANVMPLFVATPIVPTDIPIKNNTTWVRGVLHSDKVYSVNGELPYCICDLALRDYIDNPTDFKFYAACMDSVGTTFRNPTSNMQWLHSAKFETLRGWVAPSDLNNEKFNLMLTSGKYPFRLNYISEYIIYEGDSYKYNMIGATQYVVDHTHSFLNQMGWMKTELFTKTDGKISTFAVVDYSTIIKYRISTSSVVVMAEGVIQDSISRDNTMPDKVITCPVCGKKYTANVHGITCCDDPHCMSLQYNNLCHMLTTFGLPTLSWDEYQDLIRTHILMAITDVFDLPQYADVEIDAKLSTILSAIVPLTEVPRVKLFDILCGKCNNDLKTLMYYMQNPQRISTDLGLNFNTLPRFIEWLNDPANLLLFDTIIDLPQIRISLKSKKFDGLPILRDKVIYLNGDFKHGMYRDVVALLESFSATIVTEFDDKVNCVIIGDLHQNIDGRVLKAARKKHIPIFEEAQFFEMFKLDEDIRNNIGEDNI